MAVSQTAAEEISGDAAVAELLLEQHGHFWILHRGLFVWEVMSPLYWFCLKFT